MKLSLGTQLRHLLELLDGAVQAGYVEAGLDYRPRYTPVMRVLAEQDAASIGDITRAAGITQPAVTQTVSLMVRDGLVRSRPARDDARARAVRLTPKGRDLLTALRAQWKITETAARSLDEELTASLSDTLAEAIERLEAEPFSQRRAAASAAMARETADAN